MFLALKVVNTFCVQCLVEGSESRKRGLRLSFIWLVKKRINEQTYVSISLNVSNLDQSDDTHCFEVVVLSL